MGEFIGGIGAAFIMTAAIAIIVKLLIETGIIKDNERALRFGKVSLVTIGLGAVYVFAITLMRNELGERINLFDYSKFYNFLNLSETLRVAEEPNISGLFGGMRMPLYPLMVHGIGKVIFEKYGHVAQFISFAASCVSACALYEVLSERIKNDSAVRLMMLVGALPFAFTLFIPTYVSTAVAFCLLGAYALSKKHIKLFIVWSVLALLTCKIGIVAFLMYPLSKFGDKVLNVIDDKILEKGILFRIILTVFILINSGILFVAIKGVA